MATIEKQPLSSGLIQMSIATALVNGVAASIKVKMTAAEELLPTATDYLQQNNMLAEIRSRAGLAEDLTFTTLVETGYEVVNTYHEYEIQIDVANS
jgi:hypothetical protein